MTKEKINRINELAKKDKEEGLTAEEKHERERVRVLVLHKAVDRVGDRRQHVPLDENVFDGRGHQDEEDGRERADDAFAEGLQRGLEVSAGGDKRGERAALREESRAVGIRPAGDG